MAVEAQLCPQCGAAVQFGEGQTEVVCSHCGTTVVKAAAPRAPAVEQKREAEKPVQETARREKRPESQAKEEPAKRWAKEQRWKEQEAQRAAPAWGGPRHAGGVPVPQAFDAVSGLGPATAVFERDPGTWPFPSFGPPKPNELVLYRDGFAFHSGKDLHTWRWDEVAVIVSDLTTSVTSRGMGFDGSSYTLTKSSGDKVILDDRIKGIRRALETIKQHVFALRLPPLAQAYHSGQAVTFGPVTIHQQNGLQLDGQLYPWDTILDLKIDSGRFKMTLRDEKKHEARAAHIPNIELLGQLIGLKFYESSLAYF